MHGNLHDVTVWKICMPSMFVKLRVEPSFTAGTPVIEIVVRSPGV